MHYYLLHYRFPAGAIRTTRRVSGESLGLGYGRESLVRGFSLGAAGHLADADERRVAELARSAVELGDLSELERLSETLAWLKGNRPIRTVADLAAKGATSPEMSAYVQRLGILKEGETERHYTSRPSKPFSRGQGSNAQHSNSPERASEHQRARQRDDVRETQR